MGLTLPVRPGEWNHLDGLWFRVEPDPLTSTGRVAVTVHIAGAHLWFHVHGANGGVHLQTTPPDTTDEPTREIL